MNKKATVLTTMAAALMASTALAATGSIGVPGGMEGNSPAVHDPSQLNPDNVQSKPAPTPLSEDVAPPPESEEVTEAKPMDDELREQYDQAADYAYDRKEDFTNWSKERYESLKSWYSDAENWTGEQAENAKEAAEDAFDAADEALEKAGEASEEAWEDTRDAVVDALVELELMREGTPSEDTSS